MYVLKVIARLFVSIYIYTYHHNIFCCGRILASGSFLGSLKIAFVNNYCVIIFLRYQISGVHSFSQEI